MNLAAYFPVLLFLIVGTGLGVALVSIGKILGPNKPDTEKNAPYECGFEAFEDARMKFDVRYYLVAILFIISILKPRSCSRGAWPCATLAGPASWR